MDIADSDARSFNGLLGGELRLLIRALARLCDNVTAIFDCCHAAGLVGAEQSGPDVDEAGERAAIEGIARRAGERIARRRALVEREPTRAGHDPASSGAVRLVASSASERAYAYPDQSMLLFTDILVTALEEPAHAGLTWAQIIRVVRARVQALRPEQRPGVEGASDRRPFTTEVEATPIEHFHVTREGPRLRLAAGKASGIRREDRFELLAYARHDGPPLATATAATVVGPSHAFLEVPRDQPALPDVMFARRVRGGAIALAACLATADSPAERCAAAGLQVRFAAGGHSLRAPLRWHTPPGYVDLLDLLNPNGDPGFSPQLVARLPLADPNTVDELSRALRRLERWAGLAAEIGHAGVGPLAGCHTLTWGRPIGDQLAPLPPGAPLRTGESLALHIHNPGRASALHLHVYRVRADRCVEAWRDVDGGLTVKTAHALELRQRCERLGGLPGPQREWLVVAMGDGAFELDATTPGHARAHAQVQRGSDRRPGEASRVEILGFPYMLADAS